MKEKWRNTPLSRRILILLHAALILLFILLYSTLGRQQVVRHEDELFIQRREGDTFTYTGKLNGEEAVLTLLPDGSLDILVGDVHYGPYTVIENPSVETKSNDMPGLLMPGIEVCSSDEVLFRGGFFQSSGLMFFFDESGEKHHLATQQVHNSYGTSVVLVEPSLKTILRFTLARETVPRGTVLFLFAGLFSSAACMVSAFYEEELFRHRLRYSIKNAENAEPSEWELMARWISWLTFTVVALAFYITGLSAPILN